jgi:hypothetical protein
MSSKQDDVMKKVRNKMGGLLLLGMTSMGACELSMAEYYVSAFDHGDAFEQLMERNSTSANQILSKSRSDNNYADQNNLCVSQILSTEFSSAISSCEKAISNVPTRDAYEMRKKKSIMYANLAVAKALEGDRNGALVDLKKSMELYSQNKNASKNYDRLISFELAD